MKEIDAITIGAGGGAYPAAFRLKKSGYSMVMVDNRGLYPDTAFQRDIYLQKP